MKIITVYVLILFPIFLLAQEENFFKMTDSIIEVKELLKRNLSDEVLALIDHKQKVDTLFSFGILGSSGFLSDQENEEEVKVAGTCQCNIRMNEVEISNTEAYSGLFRNKIKINLSDSSYQSRIFLHSFGAFRLKLNRDDVFIDKIEISIRESKLEISPDSKFELNGIVKGKLTGVTNEYYLKDESYEDGKKVRLKVLSIFECKLQDYGNLDYELKPNLENLKRIKANE